MHRYRAGFPPIDDPTFVTIREAGAWLDDQKPVISISIGDAARAYPLQILTWHEIVNDRLGGTPVTVTFCPLCYSALAFSYDDGRFADDETGSEWDIPGQAGD